MGGVGDESTEEVEMEVEGATDWVPVNDEESVVSFEMLLGSGVIKTSVTRSR